MKHAIYVTLLGLSLSVIGCAGLDRAFNPTPPPANSPPGTLPGPSPAQATAQAASTGLPASISELLMAAVIAAQNVYLLARKQEQNKALVEAGKAAQNAS